MQPKSYYKEKKALEQKIDFEEKVISKVMVIRSVIPETGGRKLQEHLPDPEYGVPITVGRDKLFDILRAQGLLFKHKPRKVYTSVSDPDHQVYLNLLENLTVTRPNQVWVTDITYLQLVNGKHCYLSIMIDYYSRKIVGFTVQKDMTAESTLATFNKAYKSIKPAPGLIHHSDKGSQYTSGVYTNRLQECGVDISMTGPNKSKTIKFVKEKPQVYFETWGKLIYRSYALFIQLSSLLEQ